jgi:hypothetical protein
MAEKTEKDFFVLAIRLALVAFVRSLLAAGVGSAVTEYFLVLHFAQVTMSWCLLLLRPYPQFVPWTLSVAESVLFFLFAPEQVPAQLSQEYRLTSNPMLAIQHAGTTTGSRLKSLRLLSTGLSLSDHYKTTFICG